jgi:hypothetical protein
MDEHQVDPELAVITADAIAAFHRVVDAEADVIPRMMDFGCILAAAKKRLRKTFGAWMAETFSTSVRWGQYALQIHHHREFVETLLARKNEPGFAFVPTVKNVIAAIRAEKKRQCPEGQRPERPRKPRSKKVVTLAEALTAVPEAEVIATLEDWLRSKGKRLIIVDADAPDPVAAEDTSFPEPEAPAKPRPTRGTGSVWNLVEAMTKAAAITENTSGDGAVHASARPSNAESQNSVDGSGP